MPPRALPHPDADVLVNHWWWRPGWGVGTRFYAWHITLVDQPGLRDLVAGYQTALDGFPVLDLIPEQWLHITVQDLGHTRDVLAAQRDAVVDAVSRRLSAIPSPELIFDRAVLFQEAVVILPTDPEPLRVVRTAIQDGIGDVLGRDRVPEAGHVFHPHVSAAYVNATADPAPIRAALDALDRHRRARATVAEVKLIVLHRDRGMYEWEEAAACRIGVRDGG
jgi:2'-5' RNA ligase